MTSPQARIVKKILKATSSQKGYDAFNIEHQRKTFERNMSFFFPSFSKKVEASSIAGVPVAVIAPHVATERVIVYLHGGGFVVGSSKSHRQHLLRLAKVCRSKVIAIDYGLSPKHPYPYALEQIQKVWDELVGKQNIDPQRVAFMGDSAGGGLALASAMRFRDAHMPQPACIVLLSAAMDATFGGDSYRHNSTKDPILNLKKLEFCVESYVHHNSRKNPYISLVYADLKTLPPLLIHAGSDDLLFSDSQTVAKNAARDGVDVTLFVGEGMWHGWHFFASYVPEAKAAVQAVADYVTS